MLAKRFKSKKHREGDQILLFSGQRKKKALKLARPTLI